MILLDTHAWIWLNDDPSQLSRRVRSEIESSERLGVSAMSCFEVARLVVEGRLALNLDLGGWIDAALADPRMEVVPVTAAIAIAAGTLDRRRFPGDPGDRVIFASALVSAARLATKDRHLRAFDPSRTIW